MHSIVLAGFILIKFLSFTHRECCCTFWYSNILFFMVTKTINLIVPRGCGTVIRLAAVVLIQ